MNLHHFEKLYTLWITLSISNSISLTVSLITSINCKHLQNFLNKNHTFCAVFCSKLTEKNLAPDDIQTFSKPIGSVESHSRSFIRSTFTWKMVF